MSFKVEPLKKGFKVQQVVWFDAESFAWVLSEANRLGVAPNVFIAEVVRKAKEFCEKGEWTPIKVEEKVRVEEKVVYCCPACGMEFDDPKWLRSHMSSKKDHLISWLRGGEGEGQG